MSNTATEQTNWQDLIVYDDQGSQVGTLGEIVSDAPANLDDVRLGPDGRIEAWEGKYLNAVAAPFGFCGETYNGMILAEAGEVELTAPETPGIAVDSGAVNWDGFREALGRS